MSGLLPRFGQTFENVKASASNPLRVCRFVEVVHRPAGGMNPGTWWRMTDGTGEFWLVPPANCRPVGADRMRELTEMRHNHEVLVEVLVYHQRTNISGCHCGWGQRPEHLGHSYAEHVAGVYEDSLSVRGFTTSERGDT